MPTTLIWGRHDEATPLDAAQQVAERNGWPSRSSRNARTIRRSSSLEAFVRALRTVLEEEDAR